jgi:hypothetical protein
MIRPNSQQPTSPPKFQLIPSLPTVSAPTSALLARLGIVAAARRVSSAGSGPSLPPPPPPRTRRRPCHPSLPQHHPPLASAAARP